MEPIIDKFDSWLSKTTADLDGIQMQNYQLRQYKWDYYCVVHKEANEFQTKTLPGLFRTSKIFMTYSVVILQHDTLLNLRPTMRTFTFQFHLQRCRQHSQFPRFCYNFGRWEWTRWCRFSCLSGPLWRQLIKILSARFFLNSPWTERLRSKNFVKEWGQWEFEPSNNSSRRLNDDNILIFVRASFPV